MINKNRFEYLTVFILATNETQSLRRTVSEIEKLKCFENIDKIIVVTKNEQCPAYAEAKRLLSCSNKLEIYIQKADCIELCLAELPALVTGSHFVIMAADGEMETDNIDTFVSIAKEHPKRIICAAKWHKNSVVKGYGSFHKLGSRCINMFISILFNKNVTDPFSIYQIFPISVYKQLNYCNAERFVYEYTIKALRYNIEYEEIPTVYTQRTEGKTSVNYSKLFQVAFMFCLTALDIRLRPIKNDTENYRTNEVNK